MKLDKEQIARLAKLARLDLGEDKLKAITKDFDSILSYVERIQAVDSKGVEPFAMPAKAQGWRQDREVEIDDYTRELILANFPERSGDLLAAPGVFEAPKK